MEIKRVWWRFIQQITSFYFMIGNDCKGKVFMFHQVADNMMEWRDDKYCITAKSFRIFIEKVEKKYQIESIDKILKISKNSDLKCFITFDDAFACVYKEAVPILQEKKLPFTVFMTTDFIDADGYMTKEMIEDLGKNPLCTIGSHGVSHKIFRYMSKMELVSEIRDSRDILSSIIHKKVDFFAFPYGSIYACSRRDVKALEKEGYKMGFSTIKAPINRKTISNKYFLPRFNVNQNNFLRLVE